jgi:hypothetical protein
LVGGRLFIVDIGGAQTSTHTPHARRAAHTGAHLFDLRAIGPMLAGHGLTEVESGELPIQLAFFERVQYIVLARNASVS